ncbi:MAG TPA: hypothetical protein VGI54_09870 [Solirubrobacteraceae bacterium]
MGRVPLRLLALVLAGAALAVTATAAPAAPTRPLALVASYAPPAKDPAARRVADRAWTYDSAVMAAGQAATGRTAAARRLLDQLAGLQHHDGGLDFSYDRRTGRGDGVERTGAIAWIGLAAVQYAAATGSHRYDGLADGVARWLLDRRIAVPGTLGRGLVRGGPDVRWVSTEHNLEARALLAAVGHEGGVLGRRARAATAALDGAIDRELLVRDGDGRAFRQGLGDDARPLDVQALGALWLRGQGRVGEAREVIAGADATMLVSGRARRGTAPLVGYRPFADGWGPRVLWTEGTLQMRMAKAALGLDTSALDASIGRMAERAGMLPQADRTVLGGVAGDFRTWPAAAPTAWRLLSRSGSALLG